MENIGYRSGVIARIQYAGYALLGFSCGVPFALLFAVIVSSEPDVAHRHQGVAILGAYVCALLAATASFIGCGRGLAFALKRVCGIPIENTEPKRVSRRLGLKLFGGMGVAAIQHVVPLTVFAMAALGAGFSGAHLSELWVLPGVLSCVLTYFLAVYPLNKELESILRPYGLAPRNPLFGIHLGALLCLFSVLFYRDPFATYLAVPPEAYPDSEPWVIPLVAMILFFVHLACCYPTPIKRKST